MTIYIDNIVYILLYIEMWQVFFTSKAQKNFKKLQTKVQEQIVLLVNEIQFLGPIRRNWFHFSKLKKNEYHCHVKKGRPTYVVCWRIVDKKLNTVEVYYVGTHEKAPY